MALKLAMHARDFLMYINMALMTFSSNSEEIRLMSSIFGWNSTLEQIYLHVGVYVGGWTVK